MNRIRISWATTVLFLVVVDAATADVRLPRVIGENMVLQQGDDTPIWGWAGNGEQVTVRFQEKEYKATPRGGRWEVRMDGLKTGGPFAMTVAGTNAIEFKNILVGEVWVCSGQSNMEWPLRESADGAGAVEASANPRLRLLKVPLRGKEEPASDLERGSWTECGPDSSGAFSAVGYYFGRDLAEARDVPVGLIDASFGGSVAVLWVSRPTLESDPDLRAWLDEARAREEASARATATPPPPPPATTKPADPHTQKVSPSGLFNGMIAPLLPFAIRGAIWYQGESDSGRPERYPAIFHAVISSWREAWGRGEFPFLFVQLAGFAGRSRADEGWSQVDSNWPLVREAQLDTLAQVGNTAMAVAIDVGEAANIHPKDKKSVGGRLALAARAIAYGEDLAYSGPIYRDMAVEDGKVVLKFDHIGGGLIAKGGALEGFELAGPDRNWMPAKARIVGDAVEVSIEGARESPVVCYGWRGFPRCNLYNKEGLPASPFRTQR